MNISNKLANRKEPTRFILKGGKSPDKIVKAFEMMNELNKIEQPYEKDGKMKIIKHRVGLTTDCQLIIDIDNHDGEGLKHIEQELEGLFDDDDFVFIRTLNGYQIISIVKEKSSYEYKNLKVLNFRLPREHDAIYQFKEKLIRFLSDFRKGHPAPPKNLFNKLLIQSGLINPIGDFDYLYNVLCAINGHGSIRLTEKKDGDKWQVIQSTTPL